ncbi:hypothetical protein AAFN85_08250 [Mucilaginibacter sp. CAU 1740]|uniref:hypothetical protein n=1 Tax=Mucilaginibacter sp. CAU 1740 TaxID=3140365 RepID=UPI00325A5070
MKAIVILFLLTGLWNSAPPKDIAGKWQVDNVDLSGEHMNLSGQQKEMMIKKIKSMFANAVFDFNADHHFYLSPNVATMPKGDWEYNPDQGIIRIKEVNKASTIMLIKVAEKDGSTVFEMAETQLVLKVHRKS